MIDPTQIRTLVKTTLKKINLHSEEAEELILGTIAQESHMGTFIKQLGNGPALGICQMEPRTEMDIWNNYIAFKPELANMIFSQFGITGPDDYRLFSDLGYQILMCRLHYLRVPEALPASDDVKGMAAYWKKHYNTYMGSGTAAGFYANYYKYVK